MKFVYLYKILAYFLSLLTENVFPLKQNRGCGRMVVGFTTTYAIPITTKTDSHDITEILLKVSLNTINQTPITTKVVSSNPTQTRCTRFK